MRARSALELTGITVRGEITSDGILMIADDLNVAIDDDDIIF